MARRPLYGGAQGIPETHKSDTLLPNYAFTDFKHDFSGDAVTANVLNDIETQGSRASFFKKIEPLIGNDVYESFKGGFRYSLPVTAEGIGADGITEEALLAAQGIPYAETIESVNAAEPFREFPVKSINVGGIIKNYSITNVVEKPNWPGVAREYVNLLSCLWAASRGNVKFAIMYDAGVVGTSKIASMDFRSITDLFPGSFPPGVKFNNAIEYEVYFINSSENVRDPAPKIVERTFNEKTKAPNVSVYFLNDYGHHAQYKSYVYGTSDQNANLYSAYDLMTVRDSANDNVRGTITYSDGTSEQLDDVKQESQIGSCTTRALSKFLKSPAPPFTPLQYSKVMSSFMLKRSGDWCQALCLLDKQRVYTVSGYESEAKKVAGSILGAKTTLQELEDKNVEIMLMTHDRVLLTYGITLGVNVCFTNNRPTTGHWITYFKNKDIFRIDDVVKLRKDATECLEKLTKLRATANAVRKDNEDILEKTGWFPLENIATLRASYTRLANLPSDTFIENTLQTLRILDKNLEQYADMYDYFFTKRQLFGELPEPGKEKARAWANDIGKLRNALPNIQSVIDITEKYTSALNYPNQAEELLSLTTDLIQVITQQRSLKGSYKSTNGRTFNLEAAYVVIAERLIDDVVAYGDNDLEIPNDGEIPTQAQTSYDLVKITRTQIATFRGIIDIFSKALQKKGRGGGRGGSLQMGGVGAAADAYFLPRVLYLLTEISIPIKGLVADEEAFTVGEKLIHYDSWQYTISDSYIATKENQYNMYGALYSATQLTKELTPIVYGLPILSIVMFRLLILYLDILENQSRLVVDAMKRYTERDPVIDYKSPEQLALWVISMKIQKLRQIVTMAVASKRFTDEIFDKIRQYEEEDYTDLVVGDINRIGLQITFLRNETLAVYTSTLAPYMYKIRQAEMSVPPPPPPPADEGNPNFIILFDPVTTVYAPYLYTPANAQFKGNQQVILTEKPNGFSHWQNIATNVYIPLLPQPIEQPRLPGLRVGGLRPRRPLYSNAQGADSPRIHSDDDPGLRKRTGTRRTRRVRKSTRKSTGKR